MPTLIIAWLVIGVVIGVRALQIKSVGLVMAFVSILTLLHLPGAIVHALPWNPFGGWTEQVHVGTAAGVLSMFGFAVGFLCWSFMKRGVVRSGSLRLPVSDTFGRNLFVIGLVGYLLMLTPIAQIPSVPAFLLSGMYMLAVGLCLALWARQRAGDRPGYWRVLAGTAALPMLTVILMGFLGFGMSLALNVVCFSISTYRPRWQIFVVGLAIAYGGLALTGAYMTGRKDLRSVIWGGGSVDERLGAVGSVLSEIKPIDMHDEELLGSLDTRFNQGYFVGESVMYTAQTGKYANGETLWMAVAALVPRVIWPNKPFQGGSMGLVSEYTGLEVAEGTTFGVGYVMELYINFRTWGLLVGFAVFGFLMGYLDFRARSLLDVGDACGFFRSFLPGIALLNVGGQIAETGVSVVAGWVIAYAVTVAVSRHAARRRPQRQVAFA